MGQSQPHQPSTTRTFQQLHHPPLNIRTQTSILLTPQHTKIIEYTSTIESQSTCHRWQQQLRSYFSDIDPTMFYLPLRYHYTKKGYCGSAGILAVHYEYLPSTLFREIINRMGNRRKFGEGNVWRLLYTYCAAAGELYGKGKKLGKIGLESVFVNMENKKIKIATGLTFMSDCIIEQITAPETLHIRNTELDIQKSQTFSIGIVIMLAMLLIPKSPFNSTNFNLTLLNEMLKELSNDPFYSRQLREIVIGMCQPDPKERVSVVEVLRKMWENSNFMAFIENKESEKSGFSSHSPGFQMEQSVWRVPQRQQKQLLQDKNKYQTQVQTKSYSNLLALVDQQLEKSRKSFPS